MIKTFKCHRDFPYSCQQLFDLVIDIERYPYFLPWCTGSRIIKRCNEEKLYACLDIGYQIMSVSYISEVSFKPYSFIEVNQQSGPFKILKNRWVFEPGNNGQSNVQFLLVFELKCSFLNHLLQQVFEKAAHTMVEAFEKRAQEIYGTLKEVALF